MDIERPFQFAVVVESMNPESLRQLKNLIQEFADMSNGTQIVFNTRIEQRRFWIHV